MEMIALLISLLSLIGVIHHHIELRKIKGVSLKPHLNFSTIHGEGYDCYGIIVTNGGLGPAVFKSITIEFENTVVKEWINIITISEEKGSQFWRNSQAVEWSLPFNDESLSPNKTWKLFWIKKDNLKNKDQLVKFLYRDLKIEIKYQSYLGEWFSAKLNFS